jgi:hypothetical protein
VDDVEVDAIDAEPPEAALDLGDRILAAGIELRGEEDLLAGQAAPAQRLPDALLVAVRLRRVDVAIAELERPPHRVDALGPVGHLPDAQAEQGDLVAPAQGAGRRGGGPRFRAMQVARRRGDRLVAESKQGFLTVPASGAEIAEGVAA